MATLVPSYGSCARRMTNGEKRVAQRLESHLEDDYLCWYDVPIGGRQLHPDFVVLHPGRGLLILEVKDWRLETIHSVDKIACVLKSVRGLKQEANPLEQARQYAFAVHNLLAQDPLLIAPPNSDRVGQAAVSLRLRRGADEHHPQATRWRAFGRGAASRAPGRCDLQGRDDRVRRRRWPSRSGFGGCSSMISEAAHPAADRAHPLASVSGDPDRRPADDLVSDFEEKGGGQQTGNDSRTSCGCSISHRKHSPATSADGHRVIHGVAGSGKTLILGYRCVHLARDAPQADPRALLQHHAGRTACASFMAQKRPRRPGQCPALPRMVRRPTPDLPCGTARHRRPAYGSGRSRR